MTAPQPPALSLTEWLVLCLASEGSTHGFAIARLLGHQGELGQVWRVPKPVIYRGLARLEQLGLVHTVGEQSTSLGPVRSVVEATPDGRRAAAAWLATPVRHIRDVRSELMVKLALLHRSGSDPQPLLTAQREQLAPIAGALAERLGTAAGFDRTLALWRYETVSAALRFLDAALLAAI
ncbi:MAG TPA: PadR family transcriptional regulator [Streptosporangiaceae bacterium]|jgi:PadR family transcriptional regulator AphA|nr:PadR family transcriptional regulator [Streptosporangiaceae bacterium]